MANPETRAALAKRIEEAGIREHLAAMEKHRAMAELAALEGREWDREYHEAFVAAQMHQPGGSERFWAHVRAKDARRILAGEAMLTDFSPWERTAIAKEVERMKADSAAAGGQP